MNKLCVLLSKDKLLLTDLANISTPVICSCLLIPFQFLCNRNTCRLSNGSLGSVSGSFLGLSSGTEWGSCSTFALPLRHPIFHYNNSLLNYIIHFVSVIQPCLVRVFHLIERNCDIFQIEITKGKMSSCYPSNARYRCSDGTHIPCHTCP